MNISKNSPAYYLYRHACTQESTFINLCVCVRERETERDGILALRTHCRYHGALHKKAFLNSFCCALYDDYFTLTRRKFIFTFHNSCCNCCPSSFDVVLSTSPPSLRFASFVLRLLKKFCLMKCHFQQKKIKRKKS